MIIEQNVPAPVRTWAECQVEIRNNERTIRLLEDGKPIDYSSYASIKVMGRAWYREECCKPKIAALKQRNAKCRELADKISRESEISPEKWLMSKHEALNLIGNTLHYTIRGKDVYDTLLRCSEDGEQIFSSKFNGVEGKFLTVEADWLDALSLLSLGFGKAL
jgi:hypothetical protein